MGENDVSIDRNARGASRSVRLSRGAARGDRAPLLQTTHSWTTSEVGLVEWLANQVAIGLHYAQLYHEKEREVELTKLLLEISNDINARSDFGEISSFVVDRAIELLEADYGCLAILDASGTTCTSMSCVRGEVWI
jgi:GAF domain-containing protein